MLRTVAVVLSALVVPAAFAQQAISVQSGLLHYTEGKVLVDNQDLKLSYGKFPILKEGSTLSTESGRAELLLTPGSFLRLGDNGAAKMLSTSLTNTRVEVTAGSALVEVAELPKEFKVTVRVGQADTALLKNGLYRFDANPARIRVFDGKAEVSQGENWIALNRGQEAVLGPVLTATKFKTKETDELYLWTQQRAYLVAQANIGAANSLRSSGTRMSSSSWAWYPGLGMLTFVPRSGYYHSIFGYSFYSPSSVWQYYGNGYGRNNNNNGFGGGGGGGNSAWSGMGADSSRGSSVSSMPSSSSIGHSDAGRAAVSTAAPAAAAPSGGRGR